jgi:hypothetical protein
MKFCQQFQMFRGEGDYDDLIHNVRSVTGRLKDIF